MSYEDLFKNFDVLYLCHLSADCFLDEILKKNKVIRLKSLFKKSNKFNNFFLA